MTSFRVSIEPALLAWARESIGFSRPDAAKKLGVSEERLAAWERGTDAPTINQLRKASTVYKRPLAVFYLPEPPKDFDAMKDFRRLPASETGALSPQLRHELRRVQTQREVTIELAELDGTLPEPIELRLSPAVSFEQAGLRIREWLSISFEDQRAWQDQYVALNRWIAAIEAKGVLVSHISRVPVNEMRGCAVTKQPFPLIVLNGADAPRGRLFTLLHELAHVLLHDGGICDLHETDDPASGDERVEVYCNRVAGSALMPETAMKRYITEHLDHRRQLWSDQNLATLSEVFGASREAVLRRLVTIGEASMDDYLAARDRYLAGYERYREERQGEGGADFYRVQVRNLGRRFVAEVLNAYDNEHISSSEVVELLGVKLSNIPKLAARL